MKRLLLLISLAGSGPSDSDPVFPCSSVFVSELSWLSVCLLFSESPIDATPLFLFRPSALERLSHPGDPAEVFRPALGGFLSAEPAGVFGNELGVSGKRY